LVNADHDFDPFLIPVINTLDITQFFADFFVIPIEKFHGSIVNSGEESFEGFMHSVEIFPGIHDLFINFNGKMHAEKILISGVPVPENVLDEFNQQAVAFDV